MTDTGRLVVGKQASNGSYEFLSRRGGKDSAAGPQKGLSVCSCHDLAVQGSEATATGRP